MLSVEPGVMNMLSKIVSGEESEKLELQAYHLPSPEELALLIADKKRESDRSNIIEENKEDPVKAARSEANKILIEAAPRLSRK